MRTITIEEHFLSTSFRAKMQNNPPQGEIVMHPVETKLADLGAGRIADMDAGGIDLQVISNTASALDNISVQESVDLIRATNDELANAVSAHPSRFAGLATLPMLDPVAAVAEMERTISSLGFKGVIINGTTKGLFLDDPSFFPILEKAAALNVPVYLHPAEPPSVVRDAYYQGFEPAVNFLLSTAGWGWHSEIGIHSLRMMLAGVFDKLPNLQMIIGHMGEMMPFMLDRINNTLGRAPKNLQRSLPEYFLQNFTITTSGFFTEPPLLLALQVLGADRIIFSVDYPFSSNEQGRKFLDTLSLSPEDMEKITHLNAERLLHL